MDRRHRSSGRQRRSKPGLLFLSAAAFIATAALLGGDVATHPLLLLLIGLTGSWLLTLSVYQGGMAPWAALPRLSVLLLAIFVLLPLVQLVPLPASVWHALPGRALPTAVLNTIGMGAQPHPLSLSINDTALAAGVFLWLLGLVLAVVQLRTDEVRRLFVLVFALGLFTIVIGICQILSGGRMFAFYNFTHQGALIGQFSNKNHTGLFLALSLLAGYAALPRERFVDRRGLALLAPLLLVFVTALVLTFSRAGLFLGVVAIAIAIFLTVEGRLGKAGRGTAVAVVVVIAVLMVLGSSDLASRALGRFGAVTEDDRWTYWVRSWPLAKAYWPAGGGLAAFPALFTVSERLDWVRHTYLNHAHNDYLELLIEAGAAAIVLIGLAIVVLIRQIVRAWRARATSDGRQALVAAAMALLCALHSTVDYPLRRIAIAAVFAFAWGVLHRTSLRRKPIADLE